MNTTLLKGMHDVVNNLRTQAEQLLEDVLQRRVTHTTQLVPRMQFNMMKIVYRVEDSTVFLRKLRRCLFQAQHGATEFQYSSKKGTVFIKGEFSVSDLRRYFMVSDSDVDLDIVIENIKRDQNVG